MGRLCVSAEHRSSPAANGPAVDACWRCERGRTAPARTDPDDAAAACAAPQPAAGQRHSAPRDHSKPHGKHSYMGWVIRLGWRDEVRQPDFSLHVCVSEILPWSNQGAVVDRLTLLLQCHCGSQLFCSSGKHGPSRHLLTDAPTRPTWCVQTKHSQSSVGTSTYNRTFRKEYSKEVSFLFLFCVAKNISPQSSIFWVS